MNRRDSGQVGVIVAILMVTLLVAVLVLIQVYYVPNWMKDKESSHMDTVANQFSNLKFSIDLQATSNMYAPITSSITLGSKELPYFVSSRAFGSLNILPTTSSNFSIYVTSQSGRTKNLYQSSVSIPGDVSYVESISEFYLVISTLSDGDSFNVTVNGNENLEVNVLRHNATTFRINLMTINGSQILFNQTIASSIPQQEFRINLLNSDYRFSTDVLPYATTPLNLSFNASNANHGNFFIRCYKYDGSTVSLSYSMGTIRYESENSYFVDQTYEYEGGAVILGQHDGEAIISPPSFSAENYTSKYALNLSIVNIFGVEGKTSASGYGTYSIRTNYSDSTYYDVLARNVTVRINTNYPEAWGRYLRTLMNNSGIKNFTVNVNSTENYITLTMDGPSSGSPYDVELSIRETKIYAQVGPGWVS